MSTIEAFLPLGLFVCHFRVCSSRGLWLYRSVTARDELQKTIEQCMLIASSLAYSRRASSRWLIEVGMQIKALIVELLLDEYSYPSRVDCNHAKRCQTSRFGIRQITGLGETEPHERIPVSVSTSVIHWRCTFSSSIEPRKL